MERSCDNCGKATATYQDVIVNIAYCEDCKVGVVDGVRCNACGKLVTIEEAEVDPEFRGVLCEECRKGIKSDLIQHDIQNG